jgi:hypothetical protein
MIVRVRTFLIAGMLLFGIALQAVSEGFDFGGSQFDVYAPPGYSLSAVDVGLAISNADGDHTILILWGTKVDVRGLSDEDALETIVRGLYPSES